jgi:hypothetical protein
MNKLQRMVWMDFFEPLWQNRNKLLHLQKNNYETAENAALTEQLMWYQSNRHTLLAHQDFFNQHNDYCEVCNQPGVARRVTNQAWCCAAQRATSSSM